MRPIAPAAWQPGAFSSAKAIRAGRNKIRVTLKGELPSWGYEIDLIQVSAGNYELKWRSSSCLRRGPVPFERSWEFNGNFRKLSSVRISTSDGDKPVPLTSRKGK